MDTDVETKLSLAGNYCLRLESLNVLRRWRWNRGEPDPGKCEGFYTVISFTASCTISIISQSAYMVILEPIGGVDPEPGFAL